MKMMVVLIMMMMMMMMVMVKARVTTIKAVDLYSYTSVLCTDVSVMCREIYDNPFGFGQKF
jgi:hypothetical protein